MVKMTAVKSSDISSVGYDESKSELHIKYNTGQNYIYHKVPKSVYENLLQADSKGRFVNYQVKKNFTFEKVS